MPLNKGRYPFQVGGYLLCFLTGMVWVKAAANAQEIISVQPLHSKSDNNLILEQDETFLSSSELDLAQVTSVSELSDIQPTDWAFQAL